MKTILKYTTTLALLAALALDAATVVTNSYTLHNPDGTAFTNGATMAVYPPVSQSVVIVGTNIVLGGGFTINLTNDANGRGVVVCEPNQYRVSYAANNGSTFQFLVNIQATNPLPDFAYEIVGVPVIFTPNSFAAWLTNALGYLPATNTYAGITAALNYVPLTNTYQAITNYLGYVPVQPTYASVTNALGFAPAVNNGTLNFGQVTNALGFTPPTNTFYGITYALGYVPATNSPAGIAGAFGTNMWIGYPNGVGSATSLSNAYGSAIVSATSNNIVAAVGGVPVVPTTYFSTFTNVFGGQPMLVQAGVSASTNIVYLDGNTNSQTLRVTNGVIHN